VIELPSTYSVTVSPLVQLPVMAGVVLLVMLSVLELPLSVAAVISGAAGVAGAAVSIVKARLGLTLLVLPASSVKVVVAL
jgi:hypothetical protein